MKRHQRVMGRAIAIAGLLIAYGWILYSGIDGVIRPLMLVVIAILLFRNHAEIKEWRRERGQR